MNSNLLPLSTSKFCARNMFVVMRKFVMIAPKVVFPTPVGATMAKLCS